MIRLITLPQYHCLVQVCWCYPNEFHRGMLGNAHVCHSVLQEQETHHMNFHTETIPQAISKQYWLGSYNIDRWGLHNSSCWNFKVYTLPKSNWANVIMMTAAAGSGNNHIISVCICKTAYVTCSISLNPYKCLLNQELYWHDNFIWFYVYILYLEH